MQLLLPLSLLALTGLSAANSLFSRQFTPTPCPLVRSGDYIWKVSDFYARKPEGLNITALGFNLQATNSEDEEVDCSFSASVVEQGVLYVCNNETQHIGFSWQDEHGGLIVVVQEQGDDYYHIGTTTLPNYCRAGGNGPRDYVCQGVSDVYVPLVYALGVRVNLLAE